LFPDETTIISEFINRNKRVT